MTHRNWAHLGDIVLRSEVRYLGKQGTRQDREGFEEMEVTLTYPLRVAGIQLEGESSALRFNNCSIYFNAVMFELI